MAKPTLVIMAAGMGSRYGGLKQIDSVGPSGEIIMDYSIYDAMRAGFGKIVFVIGKSMEEAFRERVNRLIARHIPVEYAVQALEYLPDGYFPPPGRSKPWGTGHAVYCCRHVISEPFAVINADDFYGADAFGKVSAFLGQAHDSNRFHYCMAGYTIANTITDYGYVSRGLCEVTADGYLSGITERTRIERREGGIAYAGENGGWTAIRPDSVVSMNMWGFTPPFLTETERCFAEFLRRDADVLLSGEFFLPSIVNDLIRKDKADIKILTTGAQWYGVTYREDKATIMNALGDMVRSGEYPERLWEDAT